MTVHHVRGDVYLLQHTIEVPEGPDVPVNAFLIAGDPPIVIDAGYPAFREAVLADLRFVIDPARIGFIAITHADPDHTGALVALLRLAPRARVLANPGLRIKLMGDFGIVPEVFVPLEQGSVLRVGDRELSAHPVPLFDQPESTGYFDSRDRVFFSADCFGCVMKRPPAFADEVESSAYQLGFTSWNIANHPWVGLVDRARFASEVARVRALHPEAICSAHGPVIRTSLDAAFERLAGLPDLVAESSQIASAPGVSSKSG